MLPRVLHRVLQWGLGWAPQWTLPPLTATRHPPTAASRKSASDFELKYLQRERGFPRPFISLSLWLELVLLRYDDLLHLSPTSDP